MSDTFSRRLSENGSHGNPFPVEDLRRFYNYMKGKNLLPI